MFSLALMLYTIAVSYMNIIGGYGWNFEKGQVGQGWRIGKYIACLRNKVSAYLSKFQFQGILLLKMDLQYCL